MTSKERGISTPPVKPCRTRKRIIKLRECVCPQQTEKKINKIEFTRRYLFRENAAESHEVNEITTISATRYDVGTHEISSELAAKRSRNVAKRGVRDDDVEHCHEAAKKNPDDAYPRLQRHTSSTALRGIFAAIAGFIVVVAMEVLPYCVATVTTDDMPGESRFS